VAHAGRFHFDFAGCREAESLLGRRLGLHLGHSDLAGCGLTLARVIDGEAPSGAITLSSLDLIASFTFNSGITTPFNKKNSTKLFHLTLLLFTVGGTLFA
jgi:hypothetical protein